MYDKSKLESRKKLNLPDLLVGEGQRGLVPKLNKIFHQAVDSVQAWHTNVIHSLKKNTEVSNNMRTMKWDKTQIHTGLYKLMDCSL